MKFLLLWKKYLLPILYGTKELNFCWILSQISLTLSCFALDTISGIHSLDSPTKIAVDRAIHLWPAAPKAAPTNWLMVCSLLASGRITPWFLAPCPVARKDGGERGRQGRGGERGEVRSEVYEWVRSWTLVCWKAGDQANGNIHWWMIQTWVF